MDQGLFTASSVVAAELPVLEPMQGVNLVVESAGSGETAQEEGAASSGLLFPDLEESNPKPEKKHFDASDLLSVSGVCPDMAVRPILEATAQVCSRWFLAMKSAIGRERVRQGLYREENGLSKKSKIEYCPPILTAQEQSTAEASETMLRVMFGDSVAEYAGNGFRNAIATGDKRSFKIRLVMLKARDSLKGSPIHKGFSTWLDAYISKAEKDAGCIPCPGPRRISKKEKERKMARMGYDPRQLILPFPDFYSKEEENILLGSGSRKHRNSNKKPDAVDTKTAATHKEGTTTSSPTSTIAKPIPEPEKVVESGNAETTENTPSNQDIEGGNGAVNGGENGAKKDSKIASLLTDGRVFRHVISTVGSILSQNTIEKLAKQTQIEEKPSKNEIIKNEPTVTVTEKQEEGKVTVHGKTTENHRYCNAECNAGTPPKKTALPRKTKSYDNAQEILDDIKAGRIEPYDSPDEVLAGMKQGELTPAEAMLYLSVLHSIKSLKSSKGGKKGRKGKNSEESLNRLADEIRAGEEDEESEEEIEDYEDDGEDQDDGDEDNDFDEGRRGTGYSYNPRGFAGGYSGGGYSGGGMDWEPDDGW